MTKKDTRKQPLKTQRDSKRGTFYKNIRETYRKQKAKWYMELQPYQ